MSDEKLKHVADDLKRRMGYSSDPPNTDDVKEKKQAEPEPPKPKLAFELPAMHAAFEDELGKIAEDLAEKARAHLAKKNFAVPAKASNTGKPAYPIEDKAHARAALGFAAMHHDSKDLAEVKSKVEKKYPGMVEKKGSISLLSVKAASQVFLKEASMVGRALGGLTSEAGTHKAELAGLGILGMPVAHELHKSIKEKDKGGIASSGAELAGLGVLAAPSIAHLVRH